MAVGAQQVGQQVGIARRRSCRRGCGSAAGVALTTLGWIGTTVKPASTSASTIKPEGRSMATGGDAEAAQAAPQLGQPGRVVVDLEALDDATALVDDAQRRGFGWPNPARQSSCSWTDSCKLRYDSPCRKPTRVAH